MIVAVLAELTANFERLRMPRRRAKKIVLIAVFALFFVIVLYPWKTTVVPEWRVKIIEQSGAPVRDTAVREVWHHSSLESASHQEELITDKDGYVTFPRRTIRVPLVVRAFRPMVNALNPHGSSGPFAVVIVLPVEYDTWSNNAFLRGKPLPKEIIVKKNR